MKHRLFVFIVSVDSTAEKQDLLLKEMRVRIGQEWATLDRRGDGPKEAKWQGM